MDEGKELRQNTGEDSDMKIVGDSFDGDRPLSCDSNTIERLNSFRRSGDLSRAGRLGATLAGRFEEIATMAEVTELSEQEALHKRLLTVFAAVVAIETRLSEQILTRTALNAYYSTLKRDDPALYDSMSITGAMTFYYLSFRRSGSTTEDIGATFAMLCGRENDAELTEKGRAVFAKAYEFVCGFIAAMGFTV